MEGRWSKALDSKDVECLFGILKGRFRISKLRVRFQSLEDIGMCSTHAFDGLVELEPPLSDASATGSTSIAVNDNTTMPVTKHLV